MDSLPTSPPPDIPEADLARSLGIAREELKKKRALLTPGAHWIGGMGRPVLITALGIAALEAMLEKEAVAHALSASQQPDRYTALIVERVLNKGMLYAKKSAAADAVCRVITKPSENWRPGMRLDRCEPCRTSPGVFFYHGRLPRKPGKF